MLFRSADDQQMLEMSLVENIQRRDLNAIEVAISYQRLMEECSLTQEKLSEKIGKKRSTITNYIRLLKLPPDIQVALRDNKISMGHARAIVNVTDEEIQQDILEEIIANDLSVREVEKIVKNLIAFKNKKKTTERKQNALPEKYKEASNRLSEKLGRKVSMKRNQKGKGNISISFSSDEELENLIKALEQLDA